MLSKVHGASAVLDALEFFGVPPGLEAEAAKLGNTALSAATSSILLTQAARHAAGSNARNTIMALGAEPALASLPEAEQQRLVRYVGGTNEHISAPGRDELIHLLSHPQFRAGGVGEQAAHLSGFLKEQRGTMDLAPSRNIAANVSPAPFALGPPVNIPRHPFHSGAAPAVRVDMTVDGRVIPIFMPKDARAMVNLYTAQEVAQGLSRLPAATRALVPRIIQEPRNNPDDAFWGKKYGIEEFKSYMFTQDDHSIAVYPCPPRPSIEQMQQTLIHESGHLLSKSVYGGETDPRWKEWTDAMATDGIFPSAYAKAAKEEDFAETLEVYHSLKGTPQFDELRAMMPSRFGIMDRLLAQKFTS